MLSRCQCHIATWLRPIPIHHSIASLAKLGDKVHSELYPPLNIKPITSGREERNSFTQRVYRCTQLGDMSLLQRVLGGWGQAHFWFFAEHWTFRMTLSNNKRLDEYMIIAYSTEHYVLLGSTLNFALKRCAVFWFLYWVSTKLKDSTAFQSKI